MGKESVFKTFDAFRCHADTCKEAATCCEYLETNRAKLDYPLFRSMGLCVSSGVVEAACKWAVGACVKQAGMHWTSQCSNAIIALRCCRLSGCFEDYLDWQALAACHSYQGAAYYFSCTSHLLLSPHRSRNGLHYAGQGTSGTPCC